MAQLAEEGKAAVDMHLAQLIKDGLQRLADAISYHVRYLLLQLPANQTEPQYTARAGCKPSLLKR